MSTKKLLYIFRRVLGSKEVSRSFSTVDAGMKMTDVMSSNKNGGLQVYIYRKNEA